jgi:hypothetical protein
MIILKCFLWAGTFLSALFVILFRGLFLLGEAQDLDPAKVVSGLIEIAAFSGAWIWGIRRLDNSRESFLVMGSLFFVGVLFPSLAEEYYPREIAMILLFKALLITLNCLIWRSLWKRDGPVRGQ